MRCGGSRSGLMGLLIAGTALAALPVEIRPEREFLTKCPHCSYAIKGDFTWCPQCGSRIKPYSCDYCEGSVPISAESCPHCGAPTR